MQEIQQKFGENSRLALDILEQIILEQKDLDSDRIIRCVIYLSKSDIADWKACWKAAIEDWRDVIYWAEYEGDFKNHQVQQIRDFNRPFPG